MKDSVLKFFLIFSIIFSNAQYKEWEDLSTFKINTEEPHSFYIPKDINGDSVTKSLNGIWSFKLFKNDESICASSTASATVGVAVDSPDAGVSCGLPSRP